MAGLSGTPVLRSEDGKLVDILVNDPGEKGFVTVISIGRILSGIDYSLKVEGARQ